MQPGGKVKDTYNKREPKVAGLGLTGWLVASEPRGRAPNPGDRFDSLANLECVTFFRALL